MAKKSKEHAHLDDTDAVIDELPESQGELTLRPVPDDGLERRWYALHVYSGQEAGVKNMLLQGAEKMGLADQITNVLVPIERVAEVRAGEKKVSKRKFFPGYVLIQLPRNPEKYAELWQLIKDTPGVSGFIGSKTAPVPLDDSEVGAIIEVANGERERPRPKVAFSDGERVKIIDGPFANFLGTIASISPEDGTLKVQVEIFERLTSIEVEFWQVEQI